MSDRINVTFDEDTYNTIKVIAERNNTSMSDVVREYTYQGLKAQVGADNIDLITKIIREQLQAILKPSVERICSISAKAGVMSAAATFLNAEAINKFVPVEQQEEVRDVYETARKKGIAYMQSKVDVK